jgi:hypothetical protein
MTFGRGETRQGSPHRQEAPRFLERWARIVSVIRRQLPRSGSSSTNRYQPFYAHFGGGRVRVGRRRVADVVVVRTA